MNLIQWQLVLCCDLKGFLIPVRNAINKGHDATSTFLECANFSHSMLCGTGQPSIPHEYRVGAGDRLKLFVVNKRKALTMEPFFRRCQDKELVGQGSGR